METDNNKIFCTKCFKPTLADDRVFIEGQYFHKNCSICSICHITPSSLKMYYGQVVCNSCFKNFAGFVCEGHGNQYPGWWLQWNPYIHPNCGRCNNCGVTTGIGENNINNGSASFNGLFCSRCHQAVDDNIKVVIDGNIYHEKCAKCCMCNLVPTSLKIYYNQVFCHGCLQQHVLKHDGPSQFFQSCFEQWRGNPQFGDFMNRFTTSGSNSNPVFIMHHGPTSFWDCKSSHQWSSSEGGKFAAAIFSQGLTETDSSIVTMNQNESSDIITNENDAETHDNDDELSNVTFTEQVESFDGNISEHNDSTGTSIVKDDATSVVTTNNHKSSDSTITEHKTESSRNVEAINDNNNKLIGAATIDILEKIERLSRSMRVPGKVSCNKKWKLFAKKEELKSI